MLTSEARWAERAEILTSAGVGRVLTFPTPALERVGLQDGVGNSACSGNALHQLYTGDGETKRGWGDACVLEFRLAAPRPGQGQVGHVGPLLTSVTGRLEEIFYTLGYCAQRLRPFSDAGPEDTGLLLGGERPETRGPDFERFVPLAKRFERLLDPAQGVLGHVAEELQGHV